MPDTAATIGESRAPSAPTRQHSTYCGASDMPALLGVDPFASALTVWARKTGRLVTETSDAMHAGNDHESGVIAGYTRRVQRLHIVERVLYPGPGTLLSPKDPRRGATPDAIAMHVRRGPIGVQAKYVGVGMGSKWGPEEDGPDGVPAHVIAQVQWEALHIREVLGHACEVAHVAADIGTDRRWYEVPIDDSMIADMLDVFADFWRRHIELDEMPMVVEGDRDLLAAIYPRETMSLLDASETTLELVRAYESARVLESEASAAKDLAAAQLCAAIGEREGFGGLWGKATWKSAARASTDWKAIAAELEAPADLIAKHTKATATRRLDVRLKKAGER